MIRKPIALGAHDSLDSLYDQFSEAEFLGHPSSTKMASC
jgi:hypothetical protein